LFSVALAALTAVIHAHMDTASVVASAGRVNVPDPGRARLMALGFDAVLADFYWIHSLILVRGNTLERADERRAVGDLIELVTTLDPWVDHPYRFAALWLDDTPERVERGNDFLKRGIAYHPQDWRNRFYLGYNEFFYLGRTDAAVAALEPAITMQGAPAYLGALVARLRADSGSLEAAARFLAQLAETTEDEYRRAGYLETLDEIETERRARWLDQARVEFWGRHGHDIRSVRDLHVGPMRVLDRIPPAHPHLEGFEWSIDEENRIVSSFYGNRYKLHIQESDRRRQREWGSRHPLDSQQPTGEG
jgi:hypothetical protein